MRSTEHELRSPVAQTPVFARVCVACMCRMDVSYVRVATVALRQKKKH